MTVALVALVVAVLRLVASVVRGNAVGRVELVISAGELSGLAVRGSWNKKFENVNKQYLKEVKAGPNNICFSF